MKDAAKCDKRCEWQNSANQENAERILRFYGLHRSMSVSGRLNFHAFAWLTLIDHHRIASLCVSAPRPLTRQIEKIRLHLPLGTTSVFTAAR